MPRPPHKKGEKSVKFTISVPKTELERADALAQVEGITRSELVRRSFEAYRRLPEDQKLSILAALDDDLKKYLTAASKSHSFPIPTDEPPEELPKAAESPEEYGANRKRPPKKP